jgi:transcriptional regulator with XRE-family HTH domain
MLDICMKRNYTPWIDMTGTQLKRIRAQLGWTQAQVAKELGVTSNSVARWERDEVPIREPIARLIHSIYEQNKTKGKR